MITFSLIFNFFIFFIDCMYCIIIIEILLEYYWNIIYYIYYEVLFIYIDINKYFVFNY